MKRHASTQTLAFKSPLADRGGLDRLATATRLADLTIDGIGGRELANYLAQDVDRFLYTAGLVPADAAGKALEIGANPYFISVLMREARPRLHFEYTNYFGGESPLITQQVAWTDQCGVRREEAFDSYSVDLESGRLPVPDATYDLVLFCEVLEHFTSDPLHAVSEIARVLKPGGWLILTTPNVARFDNVVALLEGRNLYDPYSGHGPHGRHNREYTRHELHMLMRHGGFACDTDFTSDVHDNQATQLDAAGVVSLLTATQNREHDLGQYLFSRWRRLADAPGERRPSWLYRSYPPETLC